MTKTDQEARVDESVPLIQPLPWSADRHDGVMGGWGVYDVNDVLVFGNVTRDEADLICRTVNAHEELLAALTVADLAINPADREGISLHVWNGRLKEATGRIRAAIAKAEGR